jgi:hypothetical protein
LKPWKKIFSEKKMRSSSGFGSASGGSTSGSASGGSGSMGSGYGGSASVGSASVGSASVGNIYGGNHGGKPFHYGGGRNHYYNSYSSYPVYEYNPYWSSYYYWDEPNSNNNVRKAICDRACDSKIPKNWDGSANASCKLVCYQASDVLVSGKTLCETDCKINGAKNRDEVEMCAEQLCGAKAFDTRAIYVPRKLT